MQVRREFGHQDREPGLRLDGKVFEVHHQTAILVAGEKCGNLLTKAAARIGIIQESRDIDPVGAIEIIDQRKDFGSGVLGFQEGHHLGINRVHHAVLHHVEKVVGFGIDALQVTVGREHVQPFWI